MEPKIIDVPAFKLAGLQTYGVAMSGQFAKMWALLMDKGLHVPDRVGEHISYGVCSYVEDPAVRTVHPEVAILTQTAYRTIAIMTRSLGRQPTLEELAVQLQVTTDIAGQVLHNLPRTFSLDDQTSNADEPMSLFYMAAVPVSTLNNMPPNVVGKIIPANTYAVFTHKGALDETLKDSFHSAYSWLASSDYERAGPYDLEFYGPDFQGPENPNSSLEIQVPIKRKG